MKTIKVIQVARVNKVYKKDSHGLTIGSDYDVKPLTIATVNVADSVDLKNVRDEIWHLCNVDCWDEDYDGSHKPIRGKRVTLNPTEHFKGWCNSDIFVTDGTKVMRAESFGWSVCPDENYAVHSIICSYDFIKWENILNKSDFDKELIEEIRQTRKSKVEN